MLDDRLAQVLFGQRVVTLPDGRFHFLRAIGGKRRSGEQQHPQSGQQ
jgi:hypothetical protein